MKSITLICLSLFVAVSLSFANDQISREANKHEFYTLRDSYIELRYIVNELKFSVDKHLNQKDQVIARLEEKIKELESELFYTTESLRCLELEVWDMTPAKSTMESSADDVSAISISTERNDWRCTYAKDPTITERFTIVPGNS